MKDKKEDNNTGGFLVPKDKAEQINKDANIVVKRIVNIMLINANHILK